jgi:hypothetical protein
MPAANPSAQASTAMTDQVETPAPAAAPTTEEPIPLEPIALEPFVEPGAPPAESPAPEPPPEQMSTGDHPAAPPPLPQPTAEAPTGEAPAAPTAAMPKLVVVRGQRMDVEYKLYPGKNYIGRTDDKPVDIDLEDQESQDRIWTSRQHAVVTLEEGKLSIEDLNSLNGTFVNRSRVHPGQIKELQANDVIQVGTVHLKVVV